MINVAIIGAGIGAQHLSGYLALPELFNVAVFCDLNTERAQQAVGDNSGILITGDIATVLDDPAIDLVDICLPPHLHFSVALQVLEAGKHVIVEKPVVRSLAEADELEQAAAKAGRQVFPVFQYRYGRAAKQLKALIAEGLTGKPYVASIEVHWNRDAAYYAPDWRGTWAGESGGAVLGHAIHAHDLMQFFLGEVATVQAVTDTRVNDIETEDCAAISFRMNNGALVSSSVTLGAGNDTSRFRFCFAGVTVESGTAPYTPTEDSWRFIAREPVQQAQIDAVVDAVPAGHDGFAGMLEAVAAALSGAPGTEVTLADGRASIELVTAIYHSARDAVAVNLPLQPDHGLYCGWLPTNTPG